MIVLTNDGNGFGFGISGSRNSGAVVRNIFPGGAADRVSKEGQWPLFSFASFTQYDFFPISITCVYVLLTTYILKVRKVDTISTGC